MKSANMQWVLTLTVFVTLSAAPIISAAADQMQQDQEQLKVVMGFERASNSYYIALKNNSSEFLCLSTEQFDTRRGAISLHDADGKLASLQSYREPGSPLISSGFNFAEPYIFLRPHEDRKTYIDANNFVTNASVYSYEIVFSYYRCSDIIDSARFTGKKDIPGRSLHARGSIDMSLRKR